MSEQAGQILASFMREKGVSYRQLARRLSATYAVSFVSILKIVQGETPPTYGTWYYIANNAVDPEMRELAQAVVDSLPSPAAVGEG